MKTQILADLSPVSLAEIPYLVRKPEQSCTWAAVSTLGLSAEGPGYGDERNATMPAAQATLQYYAASQFLVTTAAAEIHG